MLLRFATENHLSFRDRIEFSMVASGLRDSADGLMYLPSERLNVLPAAVIYGANASGKTNLINAINMMSAIVNQSHSQAGPDDEIPWRPFALDDASRTKPTSFEADFVLDGTRYNYGFDFTATAIEAEWLYAFPTGRAQLLFKRTGGEFVFGRKLKGRNAVISDLTRKNSLFVSAAAQNDHEELTRIFRYFGYITVNKTIAVGSYIGSDLKNGLDPRVIEFLNLIETGVVGYRSLTEENSAESEQFGEELRSLITKFMGVPSEQIKEDTHNKIELSHRRRDGAEEFFDLARESAGTRRLLIMLSAAFDALDKGTLLIVDELDASLHTQACELIVAMFSSKSTNSRGAQLIATVHDTNILAADFIRRDQVWFAEKDRDGASSIYPMSDIKLRKSDNFERGYLQGRFGALPFSGSISDVIHRFGRS